MSIEDRITALTKNVRKAAATLKGVRESEPLEGDHWKAGMNHHWENVLSDNIMRLLSLCCEAELDPVEAIPADVQEVISWFSAELTSRQQTGESSPSSERQSART